MLLFPYEIHIFNEKNTYPQHTNFFYEVLVISILLHIARCTCIKYERTSCTYYKHSSYFLTHKNLCCCCCCYHSSNSDNSWLELKT